MKPTDEQLRDPKWWGENAPMGATHFDKDRSMWIKQISHSAWYWDGDWQQYKDQERFEWHMSNAESRPTPPAAPEWDGETFIQAGHRLQARVNDNPWLSGEITYRSDSGVVFRPDDGGDELFWRFALFNVEFRTFRTPEQREREELVDLLRDTPTDIGFGQFDDAPETLADAILSKYNLEPKQ